MADFVNVPSKWFPCAHASGADGLMERWCFKFVEKWRGGVPTRDEFICHISDMMKNRLRTTQTSDSETQSYTNEEYPIAWGP